MISFFENKIDCEPAMLSRRKSSRDPPAKSLANPDKIFLKNEKKIFEHCWFTDF